MSIFQVRSYFSDEFQMGIRPKIIETMLVVHKSAKRHVKSKKLKKI